MTWTYAFDAAPALDEGQLQRLLGGKGANLVVMATRLGLRVPPGFVITTEACRAFALEGWPAGLDAELRTQIAEVESAVGRRFGDADDPLLVSVRSGAPVSMPGMLDTILNVGLNDASTAGLARSSGDAAFAIACRARLDSMYRDIVGIDDLPDHPWEQLRGAIEAVLRSWDSDRARAYRAREGIPDDLGTAVVVQAMVFGNRGPDSATGVVFTRDPSTGERQLYGDVLFGAQGEDVVAGSHATEPVSVLMERLPGVAAELRAAADLLERHHRDVCDIEFTIEQGRLWLLQNRIGKRSARAALRIAIELAEDHSFHVTRAEAVARVAHLLADPPTIAAERIGDAPVLTVGLAASPGLATGAIATTPDAAVAMADRGVAVLLVRPETSPDDVHGMARAAGVLTTTGGLACHAAVVARGWDIPAVVGASAVLVDDGRVTIGEHVFHAGDVLSIDGSTGEVLCGAVTGTRVVVPEAGILSGWARELGMPIGSPGEAEQAGVETGSGRQPAGGVVTADDAVRALSIKGFVTAELLALALRTTAEAAADLLDLISADGMAEVSGGMHRLAPEGRERAAALLGADRAFWGVSAADALDGFLTLDGRMKQVVTAWQMREVDGRQVLNDHADTSYDAAVKADLADLHRDVTVWLEPIAVGLPRLAVYGARLDGAAEKVADGDHRYIASPRVDSYHGVWFELHEDLIRLAGRTREEETAAGRA